MLFILKGPLSTRYESRQNKVVVRDYGKLLAKLAATTPDGMVAFFPSYQYMEEAVTFWHDEGVLASILEHKLVFVETKDVVETTLALDNYRRACDCGRGALFLSVARGKVAEGVNFERHYGRCVVLIGIPYQCVTVHSWKSPGSSLSPASRVHSARTLIPPALTAPAFPPSLSLLSPGNTTIRYVKSRVLRTRLSFLKQKFDEDENEFLTFDAIRQASQCLGRVVRSKKDYAVLVLADMRCVRRHRCRGPSCHHSMTITW